MATDVKNYNVQTSQGRYNLVENVVEQAAERTIHLPAGYRQSLMIDVRGQVVKTKLLDAMAKRIATKTNGAVQSENIVFFGLE
jgi:hypothetical protein